MKNQKILGMLLAAFLALISVPSQASDPRGVIEKTHAHGPLWFLPLPHTTHASNCGPGYGQSQFSARFQFGVGGSCGAPQFHSGFNEAYIRACNTNGPRAIRCEEAPRQRCQTARVQVDLIVGAFSNAEKEMIRDICSEATQGILTKGWGDERARAYVREELGANVSKIGEIHIERHEGAGGHLIEGEGRDSGMRQSTGRNVQYNLRAPGIAPGSPYDLYRVNGSLVEASMSPSGNPRYRGNTEDYLRNTRGVYIEGPRGDGLPFNQDNRPRRLP